MTMPYLQGKLLSVFMLVIGRKVHYAAVIDEHMQSFAAMDDPYLRERMADVRDLGRRLLAHLQKQTTPNRDFPESSILIGEDISTATLVECP
jgi:phosphotransferase system enzyme I (PtsP)